ncbi:MAG: FMN-binding protein [Spirochaetaceae bacterium]|nr:FMN-binding protein [Spirochaetaceae bacterium]
MKNMLKLGFALAAFASVACVLLALVNNFTAPVIAQAKAEEVNAALSVVFPEGDSFEKVADFTTDSSSSIKIEDLYIAKKGNNVLGAVIQATGPTYDKATILLGMNMNRQITGIQFLSISDTPGFGQKATEPEFYTQFAGKSADDEFNVGSDVDAISGATITSRGVAQIVKYAAYVAGEYLAKNYGAKASNSSAPVVAPVPTVFTYSEAYASLFPKEQYPTAQFLEDSNGIGRIVRSMLVEKQVIVLENGKTVGAMVAVRGQTYKSGGTVLTAVDSTGRIIGARIIELNDSPNLGQKALEESFYVQFAGKNASDNLLLGQGVDAISGATITSACVADMVKVGAVEACALLKLSISENYSLNELYRGE